MVTKIKITFPVLLLFMVLQVGLSFGQAAGKNFNIVFIGNSITQGAGLSDPTIQAPPVIAGSRLKELEGIGKVNVNNAGRSGSTTLDWLPESGQLFLKAENAASQYAADTTAQLVFSIVLGTNDSAIKGPHGAPVSPENYQKNLRIITEKLLNDYPASKLIIQYPTWYSENTYNTSMYLAEGLNRLKSYFPEIDALVSSYKTTHPHRVHAGNKKVFKYFKSHSELFQPEKGQQGIFNLHPNEEGAAQLGEFWAKAIYKAFYK